jgi:ketosteroid isomerase-like protein
MLSSPEQFLTAYEQALATQDWHEIAPLIHADCTAVFTEATFKGKTAVEQAFRHTFQLIQDETYTISNVRWLDRCEHHALCIYDFAWSDIIKGQPASGGGRGTSVLKWADGRWQLLCEHLGPAARS